MTPAKWVRIWAERLPDTPLSLLQVTPAEASDVLREGAADAAFVRLPVDRTVFSAIPLYTETTVVVVPRDHVITAAEEVTVADLADEVVLHPLDDVLGWEQLPGEAAFERPATTEDAIELVAANIGVLVVPQSLARLHHRKDLTYRTIVDAPGRTSPSPGPRTRPPSWSRTSSASSAAAPSTARGVVPSRLRRLNARVSANVESRRRAAVRARAPPEVPAAAAVAPRAVPRRAAAVGAVPAAASPAAGLSALPRRQGA